MSNVHATTIFALASAPGRAGVAVFRISGPKARDALTFLGITNELAPRVASLVTLIHQGNILDKALALFFPNPHSFTGEDVVELHTHGSRAITQLLLEALAICPGLRTAEPGEFARRAFGNGKLDLIEAEGLADLIDAQTRSQHTQAMRQMGGKTSERLNALRMAILEPLALMEAYIDFPDEEIPESVITESTERVGSLKQQIDALLNDAHIGEKIREGLEIVITGPPNAGKSSLLNYLVKRDAAIVSHEAGTTRDLIEVSMEIDGYAVTIVDTAGIRETAGSIEAEGIRRALHRAEHADITLQLFDGADIAKTDVKPAPSTILVATKADIAKPAHTSAIAISTVTGEGMDQLIAAIREKVARTMDSAASPLITRARHRMALEEARNCLARFNPHGALELTCEELRAAAASIGKITGKIWVDDVLDLVFSRFCIGK